MEGNENNTPSAGEKAIADGRLEVNVGGGQTAHLDAGGKPVVKSSSGIMLDVNEEGATRAGVGDENAELSEEDLKALEAADDKPEGEADKADGEDDKAEDDKAADTEAKPYEPLPDFDPANEEIAAKYDERFLKDGGEEGQALNSEAIADEIRANMAKEGDARSERPNEGTYKWLRAKLGITREMVDAHIDGEKAKFEKNKAAFDEVTGGEEVWNAKLAWASTTADGKQGGYTKEQVARFNAAIAKGGPEAAEQIELLNERYAKANPTGAAPATATTPKPGVGLQRRPASPAKTTTTAAVAGQGAGPKPFKDASEHQKELASVAGIKSPAEREAKHKELRARLAASPWWRAGQRG